MRLARASTRWTFLAILIVLAVAGLGADALACPNCKEAVASQGASAQGQMQGYFWSILTMLSAPFFMMAGLSLFVVRACRRAPRSGGPLAP